MIGSSLSLVRELICSSTKMTVDYYVTPYIFPSDQNPKICSYILGNGERIESERYKNNRQSDLGYLLVSSQWKCFKVNFVN